MSSFHFLAVGLGAALGAWGRWLLGLALNPLAQGIPLGTLAANLIGAYLAGVAVGFFHFHADLPLALKLLVITGFLGGLTTFSSFSAETMDRFLSNRTTQALILIGLHLAGSLCMTWLGLLTVGATRIWGRQA
ncbi:MAG: fluoride efflux transporter CrcB [Zoogloeaceae bacterium]|jgi:CrcB protein|nr:fluoride efflux transporter CrcB [Zoogloeaceae bacterium]